jgi:hypothetical protein
MPVANLGKSSEVPELHHSSTIGSQFLRSTRTLTENDSIGKEANASILMVLSDIAVEN